MSTPRSKGKLFVFEGVDGCGKSTLADGFTRRLVEDGVPAELRSFPGREPGTLGWHVYQLHHDPAAFGITGLAPASLQLLHVAAHLDAIERIRPALAAGRTVVLDRFWWSTWVYGRVAGAPVGTLEGMIALERAYWADDLPDAVFLIGRHAPLGVEPLPLWRAHVTEYQALAKREAERGPVFLIANEGSPEDALVLILDRVSARTSNATFGADASDYSPAS